MASPCIHRHQLPNLRVFGKEVESCACGLVNNEIGWLHGFPTEVCDRCQKGVNPMTLDALFVKARIMKWLRLRLVRYWTWDDDPAVVGRVHKTLRKAAILLKQRGGRQMLADAIVDAVRHGFPPDRAKALVEDLLPEDAR